MAALEPTISEPVIIDGMLVGYAEGTMRGSKDGEIVIDMSFRRNWPGWWHAMAIAADRMEPDQ